MRVVRLEVMLLHHPDVKHNLGIRSEATLDEKSRSGELLQDGTSMNSADSSEASSETRVAIRESAETVNALP